MGRTALGMAWVRAEESNRPDRLFDDPYARAFVAAAPGALPEWGASAGGDFMARVLHSAVVRTRFYDDFLMDACVRGCHQVVLLAAGMDSRAFRLPWPNGGRLWEMDLPAAAWPARTRMSMCGAEGTSLPCRGWPGSPECARAVWP